MKFVDDWQALVGIDDFILQIPDGIETEDQLYELYSTSGRFPDYFGWNWNALEECVIDWEWIESKRIFLVHDGIPFKTDMAKRDIYLSIVVGRSLELQSDASKKMIIIFSPIDREDFDESFKRWKHELEGS